jgi:endonuclease YncB( thermonuclease family)
LKKEKEKKENNNKKMKLAQIFSLLLLLLLPLLVTTTTATAGGGDSFTGTVVKIIDGDTLDVNINGDVIIRYRLALVDAPERGEDGYKQAKNKLASLCSPGENIEIDRDDRQKASFGRIVAVVYCDGNMETSVNEILIESGFADEELFLYRIVHHQH